MGLADPLTPTFFLASKETPGQAVHFFGLVLYSFRTVGTFLPGRELSRAFYEEVVAPIVEGTRHSAGLLGEGSEVLGLDTDRSTDHSWGPRLNLFVAPDDVEPVRRALGDSLPETFREWPTRYYDWRTRSVDHHVEVATLSEWLEGHLGFDPSEGVTMPDWLATPQQLLLQVVLGEVFHDDSGDLREAQTRLRFYPDDVWLWMMACQWHLIAEAEPLVGRAAEVGDDLGSRLAGSRVVGLVIRLCFLQERRYAPYPKWLGTAFRRLRANQELGNPLDRVLKAPDYEEREESLATVYEAVALRHNELGVTHPLDPATGPFEVRVNKARRPYRVLNAERFAETTRKAIENPRLRELPLVGSIDQFEGSTDLLSNFTDVPTRFRYLYEGLMG